MASFWNKEEMVTGGNQEFSQSTWSHAQVKIMETGTVGEVAIYLIKILAYLDPDHITIRFISTSGIIQEEQVAPGLKLLEDFGLIKVSLEKIQIDRHVQHVIRLDLNSRGEEAVIIGRVITAIYKQFKKDEFTIFTKECMLHGLHVFQYQVQHFEATMKENWDYVSRVCFYLTQYGNYDASVKICEEASALYEEKNGAAHESTIQMKWKLAGTYSRMGKHSECLEVVEPLYSVANDALGADHWITCNILALKATAYMGLGLFEQTIGIYDEIIAATTGRYGEADLEATTRVLYYKHCKAEALLALKRFDEALELAQDVYDQRVKLFGTKDDARCVSVLNLIARIRYEKGELGTAAEVWKQVQEGFEKLFGSDNARTIAAMKDIEMIKHAIEMHVT